MKYDYYLILFSYAKLKHYLCSRFVNIAKELSYLAKNNINRRP